MLTKIASHACCGGVQSFYQHASIEIGLPMRFSVYLPPKASFEPVPALFFLAGLTCNEETFAIKGGAQRWAAEFGVALIGPDTSPRGAGVPGESEEWDFGIGASFYVDALRKPWSEHYRMYTYVRDELRETVLQNFPIDPKRLGVFGHSMGGHGALVLALRNPTLYRSVSAFAPISAPVRSPWGKKAFWNYLGTNPELWREYDATELVSSGAGSLSSEILIDQGLADQFLSDQLRPEAFEEACSAAGLALRLRRHVGYDHGYFFVSTFMRDHIEHHARWLA
jgi:S-formylglutathione hydrolase